MRNPMNSWDKSDSDICGTSMCDTCSEKNKCKGYHYYACGCKKGNEEPVLNGRHIIGPNDRELMMKLVKGGPVHAKFRRMITVYADITAPLYWWKEFDTYKVGTVANSCSTMHKIAEKEFTLDDFSHEHLNGISLETLTQIVNVLNTARSWYVDRKDKELWWQMIQLLPSSYNQKRTIMLNYEVLAGIYPMRKNHKLDEWHIFCDWVNQLPYSEIIIGEGGLAND